MRRFDKKNKIEKANLLAEQRYLEKKELVKESFHDGNGTPIPVDHNHMPIKEGFDLMSEEDTKKEIQSFIKNVLRKPYTGFLTSDLVLDKKISPKQLNDRIDWVIKTFTEELNYSRRDINYDDNYKTQWGDIEGSLNEQDVVTDLENITFSYNGKHYRLSEVVYHGKVSNGLTVKFGMVQYKEGREFPVGDILTYYIDYDKNDDKLLLTINYHDTINAKTEIDHTYRLYDNIRKY